MSRNWKFIFSGVALSTAFLMAPAAEASPTYTVKEGDTLTKIAKAHNTTIQQLKQWNQIEDDRIYILQKLVVSAGTSSSTVPAAQKFTTVKASEPLLTSTAVFYTVAKGDNLTKIAQKYDVTVEKLQQWNQLTSDAIYAGQKLAIEQENGKDLAVEAPTASKVEAVIKFTQTADEAIARQLSREKTLPANISPSVKELYAAAIELADTAIGIPYKYGGTTMEGFDCSGFVSYVYNLAGIPIERKSSLMYFEQDTTKVAQPVPGDFVFFKNTFIPTISHMGIYIGNDQFIHAGSKGVTVSNVNETYWAERFVAYKRLTNLK